MSVVIQVDRVSKQYRLGAIGGKRLVDDLNRWWARLRGKDDPLSKIGEGGGKGLRRKEPAEKANGQSDTIYALKDVSFEVKQGEVLGIIGRNGAGKSTLLKILSRVTAPSSGEVRVRGRIASLLEVGTGFHPELTGRENIFLNGAILGMTRAEIRNKLDDIVAFAEIEKFLDTPVKRYSSGMYVRLAFAVAAHLEPEILIVDEVLAVGDAEFQRKCLGKMRDVAGEGRTVLFVSHNMGAVSQLCSRAVLMENGALSFSARTDEVLERYNRAIVDRPESQAATISNRGLPQNAAAEFYVKEVQLLDVDGHPKPVIRTCDSVVLRFVFHAPRPIQRAAIEFEIRTFDGARLFCLATLPDGGFPVSFRAGMQSVDCIFDSIPLAAGDYVLGVGMAIPQVEWLWRMPEFGRITVVARDIYDSGRAPSTDRCLIAAPHKWKTS
jgi:lipopolysaccharide transport system ATP-binding protein